MSHYFNAMTRAPATANIAAPLCRHQFLSQPLRLFIDAQACSCTVQSELARMRLPCYSASNYSQKISLKTRKPGLQLSAAPHVTPARLVACSLKVPR